ncbi:MAG: DUF4389 domain-containing protein [Nocardiopsaceae bacterium]|jgi:hypothetical protein|nr:DUF4389 domain-containing protein [Nocardiopsaceae bacterium]
MQPTEYPVQFAVDYPGRQLNRLTTLIRPIMALPILAVLIAITGWSMVLSRVLVILFRGKYPRWWFDWSLELHRFINRVAAYLALMDDRYPSTDERQSVRLAYPGTDSLSRWLPLVKWLLVIPHRLVLAILDIAAVLVVLVAWAAILVTGVYPRGLFGFVEGVLRWHSRVTAYSLTLVTDRYPPFRLSP